MSNKRDRHSKRGREEDDEDEVELFSENEEFSPEFDLWLRKKELEMKERMLDLRELKLDSRESKIRDKEDSLFNQILDVEMLHSSLMERKTEFKELKKIAKKAKKVLEENGYTFY